MRLQGEEREAEQDDEQRKKIVSPAEDGIVDQNIFKRDEKSRQPRDAAISGQLQGQEISSGDHGQGKKHRRQANVDRGGPEKLHGYVMDPDDQRLTVRGGKRVPQV